LATGSFIGVFALQGDFERHRTAMEHHGLSAREIRHAAELACVAGLVLPGGESTAMLHLIENEPWDKALRDFAASGRPIFATCAGLILLARRVSNPTQRALGLLDVDVVRNAYGRQIDSFVGRAVSREGAAFEAVFIRAPKIDRVGREVEVLASVGGDPVLVREGNITASTYHPELSPSSTIHAEIFGSFSG
jgi:pyridoxal 5'-phosphate synthase pdxT subunit